MNNLKVERSIKSKVSKSIFALLFCLYSIFVSFDQNIIKTNAVTSADGLGVYTTGLVPRAGLTFNEINKTNITGYTKDKEGITSSLESSDGSDPESMGGFSSGRTLTYYKNNNEYLTNNPSTVDEYFKLTGAEVRDKSGAANFNYLVDVTKDFTLNVGFLQYGSIDEVTPRAIADGIAINFFSGDRSSIGNVGGRVGSDFQGNEAILFRNYGSSVIGASNVGTGVSTSYNYDGTTNTSIIQNTDIDGKSLLATHSNKGGSPSKHLNLSSVGIYEDVTLSYNSLTNELSYRVTAIDQGCSIESGCSENDINDSGEQVISNFFNNDVQPLGAGSSHRYISISGSSGMYSSAKYITNIDFSGSASKTVEGTVRDLGGNGILDDGEIVSYEVGVFNGDSNTTTAKIFATDSMLNNNSIIDQYYGANSNGVVLAEMQSLPVDETPLEGDGINISSSVSYNDLFGTTGITLDVPAQEQTVARILFKTISNEHLFFNPTFQYNADGLWRTEINVVSPNSASSDTPFTDESYLTLPYANQNKKVNASLSDRVITPRTYNSLGELYNELSGSISDAKFPTKTQDDYINSQRVSLEYSDGTKVMFPTTVSTTTKFNLIYTAGTVGEDIKASSAVSGTLEVIPGLQLNYGSVYINDGEDAIIEGVFNEYSSSTVSVHAAGPKPSTTSQVVVDNQVNSSPGVDTAFSGVISDSNIGINSYDIYTINNELLKSSSVPFTVNVRGHLKQSSAEFSDGLYYTNGGFKISSSNGTSNTFVESTEESVYVLSGTSITLTANDLSAQGYVFDKWIDAGGSGYLAVPAEILNDTTGVVTTTMPSNNFNVKASYKFSDNTKSNLIVRVFSDEAKTTLVDGADVKLVDIDGSSSISNITDLNGEALFTLLNPSSYLAVSFKGSQNGSGYITLQPNSTVILEIVLNTTSAVGENGFVFGNVIDELSLKTLSDVLVGDNSTTDSKGNYVVIGLNPAVSIMYSASKTGYDTKDSDLFTPSINGTRVDFKLSPSALDGKGNLKVRVLENDGVTLKVGAKVTATSLLDDSTVSGITNADGTYTFRNLEIAEYVVIASDGINSGNNIAFTIDSKTVNTDVILSNPFIGDGFVYGKVKDKSNLMDLSSVLVSSTYSSTVTTSNGTYVISNLPLELDTFNLRLNNYEDQSLDLIAETTGTRQDFMMNILPKAGMGNIIVTVYNSNGEVESGATVYLNDGSTNIGPVTTLSDGSVTFMDLAPSTYSIVADDGSLHTGSVIVDLVADTITYATITLSSTSSEGTGFIFGKVFDASTMQNISEANVDGVVTDLNGNYILSGIDSSINKTYIASKDTFEDSISEEVVAKLSGTKVDFQLIPKPDEGMGNLVVTVIDQNETDKVAGARVTIANVTDGSYHFSTTFDDGTAFFKNLVPGIYAVVSTDRFFSGDSISSVIEGETTNAEVIINSIYAGESFIYGTVTDSITSLPVQNAILTREVSESIQTRMANGKRDSTDLNGVYVISNMEENTSNYNVTKIGYYSDSSSVLSSDSGTMNNYSLLQLPADGKSNMVVTVLDVDGITPVEDAYVDLVGFDSLHNISNTTDYNGKAIFNNIEVDKYIVNAYDMNLQSHTTETTISGETSYVTVILYNDFVGSGVVFGKVHDSDDLVGISAAKVYIGELGAISDENGDYVVSNLDTDFDHSMTVHSDGYHHKQVDVVLDESFAKHDVALDLHKVELAKTGYVSYVYFALLTLSMLYILRKKYFGVNN